MEENLKRDKYRALVILALNVAGIAVSSNDSSENLLKKLVEFCNKAKEKLSVSPNDFEIGDDVIIHRRPNEDIDWYTDCWVDTMDKTLGKKGKVLRITQYDVIVKVECSNQIERGPWHYPPETLRKIKKRNE